MRKAIYDEYGEVDSIKIIEAEIPALFEGEVLVKVEAAALNPKDVLIRKGKFRALSGSRFPQGIGYDFAGRIEDPNGSEFFKGQKVYGMVNGIKGRTCAEYLNVDKHELCPMPEKLTFEEAAGIPLAAQTALQAIRNLGKLSFGQKILINGASGGVGTLAIQIAKALGGEVTTVSSTQNQPFCTDLGADHALSYQEVSIPELSEQYEVFFDVFGNYSIQKIQHLLSPKGIYITTVPNPEIIKEQLINPFRRKKAKMVVVKSNREDLQWLVDNIEDGSIKAIIGKVYSLEQVGEAQSYIETKRAKGKVIIKI